MTTDKGLKPTLINPFAPAIDMEFTVPGQVASAPGLYEKALKAGYELQQRPRQASGIKGIERQHQKQRMTIWERIDVLTDETPTILYQNWGA